MEQQIHFCTTDDNVRIAYATLGEGPPLVKAATWLSHLKLDAFVEDLDAVVDAAGPVSDGERDIVRHTFA